MISPTLLATWLMSQLPPSAARFVEQTFGGDAPGQDLAMHQVAARCALVYVLGLLLVRIGKSRMIGRATPLDVVVAFMLGSLLSRGITGDASLSGTIAASLTLILAHWLLTYAAMRSHWFGRIFKGNAHRIVLNGQMLQQEMRRSHISEHDLIASLRLEGVSDISQVAEAWKERSGEISVIRKPQARVVEVKVEDGVQTVRVEVV